MMYLPYPVYQPALLSQREVRRGTPPVRHRYSNKISDSRSSKRFGTFGTASTAIFNSFSEYISDWKIKFFSSIQVIIPVTLVTSWTGAVSCGLTRVICHRFWFMSSFLSLDPRGKSVGQNAIMTAFYMLSPLSQRKKQRVRNSKSRRVASI